MEITADKCQEKWAYALGAAKLGKFLLLPVTVLTGYRTANLGAVTVDLVRIQAFFDTTQTFFLSLHTPITLWNLFEKGDTLDVTDFKKVNDNAGEGENANTRDIRLVPNKHIKQLRTWAFLTADLAITAMFLNHNVYSFLGKTDFMERRLMDPFVLGVTANLIINFNQTEPDRFEQASAVILMAYAVTETTAWAKGADYALRGLGQNVPLWPVRSAVGVASGVCGIYGEWRRDPEAA